MTPRAWARRDPADLLAAIPGMAGGRVVRRLADGPTNASYLVEHAGEPFVLRLDQAETRILGLDRHNERAVCAAVAAAGLGPAYRHFDPAAGVCLRPFVTGRCLQRADLADLAILQRLAAALRSLHGLEAVGAAFAPLAAARRYAEQLGTAAAAALAERAAEWHAGLARDAPHPALCHNDLVCENVLLLQGHALLLIDWEYAGIGDPYFDLAVVVRHHDLGKELTEYFLAAYLQRPPQQHEIRHLAGQCAFYGCLLELWNLRVGK
ncbi:MAG: phosphotransferase family protein [Xanthomonadales bacterium]|nr:phosphotransferase family protein [Xanthomonadales bacterium]